MLKREDAMRAVVKFATPVINNGETTQYIGPGFFIFKDSQLYLITANHVSKKFNYDTVVYLAGGSNKVISTNLSFLQLSNIIDHSHADISAIPINIQSFKSLNATPTIYDASLIDTTQISNISRDDELLSIGFPNGLGISHLFEPLSFRSFPASNIIKNVSGLDGGYTSDVFFMENASCGGYSGCPVLDLGYKVNGLITQSYDTQIYGVMHGTMCDETGGKMAVVTPAYYILQII